LRCFSYVSAGRIAFAVTTNSLECTNEGIMTIGCTNW
jgi:hypothetical protein